MKDLLSEMRIGNRNHCVKEKKSNQREMIWSSNKEQSSCSFVLSMLKSLKEINSSIKSCWWSVITDITNRNQFVKDKKNKQRDN